MVNKRIRKTNHQLTAGSIRRSLRTLALPLMAGTFLHNLFNLVDLFFIGKLGPVALAAISVAGVILAIIIMAILGISTGTTALIAHYTGKKDYEKADNVLAQAVILSFIGSAVILLAGLFGTEPLLKLVGATPEVIPYSAQYLKIIFSFSLFIFLFFTFNQSLRGSGDAVTPLRALILANIINIILDPFLIFGIGFFPRLEVAGSALATVISRGIGLIFLIRHLVFGFSSLHLNRQVFNINLPVMGRIAKIGFFSSLEVLLRQISLVFLIKIISLFGTTALAAYGIVVRIRLFMIMFGIATGTAAGILIGQNMGNNRPERARRSGWQAVKYYQFLIIPIAVLLFIFARPVILLFTNDSRVASLAITFLRFISVSLPFLTPALVLGKGISAAGDTAAPAAMTGVFHLIFRIPFAYIGAKIFALKVIGVYLAITGSDLLHGITMGLYFRGDNWQSQYYRHRNILERTNL